MGEADEANNKRSRVSYLAAVEKLKEAAAVGDHIRIGAASGAFLCVNTYQKLANTLSRLGDVCPQPAVPLAVRSRRRVRLAAEARL